jgi:hypothetical protein
MRKVIGTDRVPPPPPIQKSTEKEFNHEHQ